MPGAKIVNDVIQNIRQAQELRSTLWKTLWLRLLIEKLSALLQ